MIMAPGRVDPPFEELANDERETALRAEIASLREQLDQERGGSPHSSPVDSPKRPSTRRVALILFIALAVAAVAFFSGYLPRSRRSSEVTAEAKSEAAKLPVVTVIPAKRAESIGDLTLPVNVQAVTEAPILARADGYLKKRYVDIGDRVRGGQLLAEIEAPELDQQVEQAKAAVLQQRATVEQARAAYQQGKVQQELARVTAQRWSGLLTRGAVSRQENDQYQAQFQAQSASVQALDRARAAAEQNLIATEANLSRLTQVQSYKQVRAPFPGVITLRNTDTGALISLGQTLLFRIAQTDMLRAYINVPQSDAEAVRAGEKATIQIPEFPGRDFEGTVVRSSSALDPTSRTLLTEVRLPNRDGLLLPGIYGQVVLHHRQSNPPLLIGGGTLIIGAEGTRVATVDSRKRVHFRKVVIGRDLGQQVEILSGLQDGDLCINNPSDDVREGAEVEPRRAEEPKDK